jgi:1-deoxy-D-xylulose-5-phosphate reductoisomerase
MLVEWAVLQIASLVSFYSFATRIIIPFMTKTIAIFGSTGSIGCNTLEVVRQHPDLFHVQYLTANSNAKLLCEQIREFKPRAVVLTDPVAFDLLREQCNGDTELLFGPEGLNEIARRSDYDTLVSSLVGFAGLVPTIAAIESGHHIALANKETLVVAGKLMTELVKKHNVDLLPIDSEHSAIWQCITGEPKESIKRIILTASGGPFRGKTAEELETVSITDALNHPNWKMGSKITIDSATLMNKGLEVIEAKWLFDVSAKQIDVIVHPQSIIHSMVEFSDGSIKAQLGLPDMKLPIRYALSYPERLAAYTEPIDFTSSTLEFEAPDRESFRCLSLAFEALESGGTATTTLNAANEIAVGAFLDGKIGFMDIPAIIERSLNQFEVESIEDIDVLIDADKKARNFASTLCKS